MEAFINTVLSCSIYMVLTQLLINFAQFVATGRLCSNLPNCAATPKNTKIRLFEAKWQLLPEKKHCYSNPMALSAFRLLFYIC